MGAVVAGMVIVAYAQFGGVWARDAGRFESCPKAEQWVSEGLQKTLRDAQVTCRYYVWPSDVEDRRVPQERIPDTALAEADHWIRTFLKDAWCPDDLRGRWIGLTEDSIDQLLARYRVEGSGLQVVDYPVVSFLLISVAQPMRDGQSIESFLSQSIGTYLNLDADRHHACEYRIVRRETDPNGFYRGAIVCGIDPDQNEQWAARKWWNWIPFWTDGKLLALSLTKASGAVASDPQAQPGMPRRFLP